MSGNLAPRSRLAWALFSPGERRLRAGWRLLGHTGLLVVFGLVFSVGLAIPLALLEAVQRPISGELALGLSTAASLPAVTLATWVARRRLDRRSFGSLGLPLTPAGLRDLLVGIAIPLPLFGLIYLVEVGAGWLEFQHWGWTGPGVPMVVLGLLLSLLAFLAVGFYEELLFRGYYLQNLAEGINIPAAVVVSSAGFGLAHLSNPNASLVSSSGILAAGLFLAYAWLRTRALWLPIGLHIGWNFIQGPVFGYPVSGIPTPSLVSQIVEGPELVTGGDFGPEAGLIVLPALAIGTALVWWYTRGSPAPAPTPA